ncbi:hypothetical protein OP10G_1186 [Fimbriimonas ginsengisoli Gsoil 348]|uniref:Uncharacterized protein n=1 Tax=Fimbriimonas ginsengisoli Gsoil 348 TaxID=661478 RepID=A0A068NSK2_FIMGI|nr:hypothetical protein OP10G_1186 [Fimbriimonas ginsengisoli Gsoil 348]
MIGKIKWEIQEVKSGKTLGAGEREVRLKDVRISKITSEGDGSPGFRKEIPLGEGFKVALLEFPTQSKDGITGFGLSADRPGVEDYSLEWFTVEGADHALKLQEPGELSFGLTKTPSGWEQSATEFVSDVSLRIVKANDTDPDPAPVWRVKIFNGSVVDWPRLVNGKVVPN